MSHLPPRAQTLVPGKHRFVTHERMEKFTSDTFWQDSNLISVENFLRSKKCVEAEITIKKWTQPASVAAGVPFGYDRTGVTFDIAKSMFDNPKQAETWGWPPSKVEDAKIGDKFGPLNTLHWFKVNVKVTKINPENVKRKVDVQLHWFTGTENLVYNSDGKVICGITGEDHGNRRDFIPFAFDVDPQTYNNGKPLEAEFYLEMQAAARMGDGEPTFISAPAEDRYFTLKKAEVHLIDRTIRRLKSDIILMHSFATVEGVPDMLREDALNWGNRVVNAFIHDQPETHVVAAKIADDFFQKHSAPRPQDTRDTITLLGNCHIDLCWLFDFSTVRRKIARSWSSQLLLAKSPDREAPYKFVASQAVQFQWLLEDYPELFERVKAQCRKTDGSFVALGATWVEMDGNLPSGESFVRQFLLGQNFYREHFDHPSPIFWLPDTFGYSGQLPQIATHCGVKYFVSQKLSWNLINKPIHTTFYWKGIDGITSEENGPNKLLAHFPPQDDYCCQVTTEELVVKSAQAKQNRDIGRCNEVLSLYGDGDGGGGPKEPLLLRAERFEKMTSTPLKVHTGRTPLDMFKSIEQKDKKLPQLETHVGELYFEMHRGTFSVHRRFKSKFYEFEDLLRVTESICALASITSRALAKKTGTSNNNEIVFPHPTKQLWHLWNDCCILQFHDELPGSSIHKCYDDGFAMMERAKKLCETIIAQSSRYITSSASTPLIMNFTPVQVDSIPSFGVCTLSTEEQASDINVANNCPSFSSFGAHGAFKIENTKMICIIENDGRISSLKMKNQNKQTAFDDADEELVDHVGGSNNSWLHWNLYDDQPLFWDAWDVECYHAEKPLMSHGATVVTKTSIVQSGHTVEAVTELSVLTGVTIQQRVIFNNDTSDIRVHAAVKNWANEKSKHRILKCLFGCNIVNPNAFFGTAFGALARPTHRNTPYDLAKFEVCYDRWLDFSQTKLGVTIANNCGMRGASVHGSTIQLSVLRAPTSPDPKCDEGDHDISFVIRPHNCSSYVDAGSVDLAASLGRTVKVVNNKAEVNTDTTDDQTAKSQLAATRFENVFQLAQVNCPDLHITAVKLPEYHKDSNDSIGVIVRLYECNGSCVPAGRALSLLKGQLASCQKVSAHLTDGLERENFGELSVSKKDKNSFVLPEFKPFQIRTVKFNVTF